VALVAVHEHSFFNPSGYGQAPDGNSVLIVAVACSVLVVNAGPPKYEAIPATNEYVCGYATVTGLTVMHWPPTARSSGAPTVTVAAGSVSPPAVKY